MFKRLGLLITTASLLSGGAMLAMAAPASAAPISSTGGTPQQNYVSGLFGDYLTYNLYISGQTLGVDFATSQYAAVCAATPCAANDTMARQNDGTTSLGYYTGLLGLATVGTPPAASAMNNVSTQIINSSEFRNDLVSQDFVCYLGRTGDATGLAYYDALKGATINSLATSFLSSSEFFNDTSATTSYPGANPGAFNTNGNVAYGGTGTNYCGATHFQTTSATAAAQPVGNFDTWLTDVYGVLLNRSVDSSSKTFWDGQYVKGVSLSSIVTSILNSSEYETDQVTNMYTHFLRDSAPDASGIAYWVGLMKAGAGATPEQVMASITSSSQYWAWTQTINNV